MDFRTIVFFIASTVIIVTTLTITCACAVPFGQISSNYFISERLLRAISIDRMYKLTFISADILFLYRIGYTMRKALSSSSSNQNNNVQKEIQDLIQSNGFQLIMFSFLMMFRERPMIVSLIPIFIYASYQWMTIVYKQLHASSEDVKDMKSKLVTKAFLKMQSQMVNALFASALIEIGLFPVILIEAVQKKQMGKTFAYVMWLRTRYSCKDNTVFRIKFAGSYPTSFYHREAWTVLNVKMFKPVTSRVIVLQKVSDGISNWFTKQRN
jgi:transmembrane protein 33